MLQAALSLKAAACSAELCWSLVEVAGQLLVQHPSSKWQAESALQNLPALPALLASQAAELMDAGAGPAGARNSAALLNRLQLLALLEKSCKVPPTHQQVQAMRLPQLLRQPPRWLSCAQTCSLLRLLSLQLMGCSLMGPGGSVHQQQRQQGQQQRQQQRQQGLGDCQWALQVAEWLPEQLLPGGSCQEEKLRHSALSFLLGLLDASCRPVPKRAPEAGALERGLPLLATSNTAPAPRP